MANDGDGIQRIVNGALTGLGSADILTLARQLALGGAMPIEQLVAATKPPVRRRPRRAKPVTLRVRVDLAYMKPPVWRRLELASDLFLDDVHEIMQAAFGWTDSVTCTGSVPGRGITATETEHYLCPFSAGRGRRRESPRKHVRLG